MDQDKKFDLAGGNILIVGGVASIAGALGLAAFGGDSNVPNDPNIGAGLLLIFGVGLLIAGIASARSRRKSTMPTEPPSVL